MIRRATLALLALPLAGCQQMTLQAGDFRATQTSFLTKNTLTGTCNEFGADGTPRSSSAISSESTGDTASIHEIFTGVGGIVAQLKPPVKPPGAPLRGEGMVADNGQKAAAACVLEHFQGETAPFPPQAPLQQSQADPVDHGEPARADARAGP
jgi:hypothetical protein